MGSEAWVLVRRRNSSLIRYEIPVDIPFGNAEHLAEVDEVSCTLGGIVGAKVGASCVELPMARFRRRQMGALGCRGIETEAEKRSGEIVAGAQVSAGSENMVPRWLTARIARLSGPERPSRGPVSECSRKEVFKNSYRGSFAQGTLWAPNANGTKRSRSIFPRFYSKPHCPGDGSIGYEQLRSVIVQIIHE